MRRVAADDLRAFIAAAVLGDASHESQLGDVTLYRHQQDAIERLRQIMSAQRGALLADDVGLGKTFVALASARGAREVVVVGPASLRDSWTSAGRTAGVELRWLSFDGLARSGAPPWKPDVVIIDEAHHLRSRQTRRFAAALQLCADAKVLLLTATPLQNRLGDLRAILSLFLGERADAMSADEMSRYVVRRTAGDVSSAATTLPRVRDPEWLVAGHDVDCLDRILALPLPVPPADGDSGGVLLTYTLVRQWASSRSALRSALRRRLARAAALEDALLAGRMPTRSELAHWAFADGAQQLAFPELTVASTVAGDAAALLDQLRAHADAARELIAWLDASPNPDVARAAAVSDLLRRHPGERVIAFSEFADTVAALYRDLARTHRVAMLTHGGGRVAGGPLTRREILERFAPGSSAHCPERERIDLLVTTDVLSEGVNLQDASVVLHVDLPWNPARLEQRVGRVRRIGAARDSISVYVLAPPAPAERLLRVEQRLRDKLNVAARAVGVAGAILPGPLCMSAPRAATSHLEHVTTMLRGWRGAVRAPDGDGPVVAIVRGAEDLAIACIAAPGQPATLAVMRNGHVTAAASDVERAIPLALGEDVAADDALVATIRSSFEHWLRRMSISSVVDLGALRVARSRRELLRRVDGIVRRSPRHVETRLAPLVRAARMAAAATLSAGAERVLDQLARAPMPDDAWLSAIGEFAALNARDAAEPAPKLRALLIVRRP